MAENESDIRITTETPYLALAGELWGVFCEDFGEKWLRYNDIALQYVLLQLWQRMKPLDFVNRILVSASGYMW